MLAGRRINDLQPCFGAPSAITLAHGRSVGSKAADELLVRILIAIIIGGLALIGYLLFVLRVTNRDDRK
jgi:hypothetical protein